MTRPTGLVLYDVYVTFKRDSVLVAARTTGELLATVVDSHLHIRCAAPNASPLEWDDVTWQPLLDGIHFSALNYLYMENCICDVENAILLTQVIDFTMTESKLISHSPIVSMTQFRLLTERRRSTWCASHYEPTPPVSPTVALL